MRRRTQCAHGHTALRGACDEVRKDGRGTPDGGTRRDLGHS